MSKTYEITIDVNTSPPANDISVTPDEVTVKVGDQLKFVLVQAGAEGALAPVATVLFDNLPLITSTSEGSSDVIMAFSLSTDSGLGLPVNNTVKVAALAAEGTYDYQARLNIPDDESTSFIGVSPLAKTAPAKIIIDDDDIDPIIP